MRNVSTVDGRNRAQSGSQPRTKTRGPRAARRPRAQAATPAGGCLALPGGPFEVRWGAEATSSKMSSSSTGIMQVNLKKAVGERIRIDYFPNNQLGKESDVVQQVKVGSIDMMLTGSSIWATVTPQFGMLDLGYLFDSYEQLCDEMHFERLTLREPVEGHGMEPSSTGEGV